MIKQIWKPVSAYGFYKCLLFGGQMMLKLKGEIHFGKKHLSKVFLYCVCVTYPYLSNLTKAIFVMTATTEVQRQQASF